MAQPLRMGVVYDFRNPLESGMRTPDFYAAVLEQVTWLDSLGLDLVWFTEHHFVDDGYPYRVKNCGKPGVINKSGESAVREKTS